MRVNTDENRITVSREDRVVILCWIMSIKAARNFDAVMGESDDVATNSCA